MLPRVKKKKYCRNSLGLFYHGKYVKYGNAFIALWVLYCRLVRILTLTDAIIYYYNCFALRTQHNLHDAYNVTILNFCALQNYSMLYGPLFRSVGFLVDI